VSSTTYADLRWCREGREERGLAETAGTVGTTASVVGFAAQSYITDEDCKQGVDASCVANGASTVLAAGGLAGGYGAGLLAAGGSELAEPLALFGGLVPGIFSYGLGAPGVGGYMDRSNC
jgi:hypothetical protein